LWGFVCLICIICAVLYMSLFVIFSFLRLVIILLVLRFTASEYPFGIFNVFVIYQYPERGHICSARSLRNQNIMKRRFKQWWSTIPPISTKRTINHLSAQLIEQVKETTRNDIRNPCPGTGTGTCGGGVKPANGIPAFPSWYLHLQLQNLYTQTIEKSAQVRLHSRRPHTITKLNNNTNMDSAIAGLMNARS
jgi:hypothetical protein